MEAHPRRSPPSGAKVRPLVEADIDVAATLHGQVLAAEFISQAGPGFLRDYYRAWLGTGAGLGLVAEDGAGELVGVLLGTLDPAQHYRFMLRRHGLRLAGRLVVHSLGHPRFGCKLVVTRGRRYTRGVARVVLARRAEQVRGTDGADEEPIGEVSHVLVRPSRQGTGVGRVLLGAAVAAAERAGLAGLSLVTTPDLARSGFYDGLGWSATGPLTSRSGERFVGYRVRLNAGGSELSRAPVIPP